MQVRRSGHRKAPREAAGLLHYHVYPNRHTEPRYTNTATVNPPFPSDDTRDFIELARVLLEGIRRDGYRYLKAGIMLCNFSPPRVCQRHLFEEDEGRCGSEELMESLESWLESCLTC
ncbi:hypothetical protein EUZ85_23345 [Hahella sp. KA22]|nr:hypothetical protein ENC22_20765 [Hahella sp. KA22]QAY56871.1 hypothetical protein EUZ85_23345 [Hahella sp. KA22]